MKHLIFITEQTGSSIQAVYDKQGGVFRIEVSEEKHLASHCFESLDEALDFANHLTAYLLRLKVEIRKTNE
jgi:hypothetical protein